MMRDPHPLARRQAPARDGLIKQRAREGGRGARDRSADLGAQTLGGEAELAVLWVAGADELARSARARLA